MVIASAGTAAAIILFDLNRERKKRVAEQQKRQQDSVRPK
jgi:hypothetical protein